jgi:ribosomal protein L12E/L44/L45/RPP1/RPP2
MQRQPSSDSGQQSLQAAKPKRKRTLQSQFESLMRSITQTEHELADIRQLLDSGILWYDEHLRPLVVQEDELRIAILEKLAEIYDRTEQIPKTTRKDLEIIIMRAAQQLLGSPGPLASELIKRLADQERKLRPPMNEEVNSALRDILQTMAEARGVVLDTSEVDDFSDYDQLSRAFEKARRMQATPPVAPPETAKAAEPRKKTAKQEERERLKREVEELKDKSLNSLFRQLAKVLHPDLEPDPALKAEREALMKDLTQAYENRDLSTLLKMELRWLKRMEHDLEALGEQKAKVYIELLREQQRTLRNSINELLQHPRYYPVLMASEGAAADIPFGTTHGPMFVARAQRIIQSLKDFIASLDTPAWKTSLREMAKAYRAQERERDFDL